MLKIRYIKHSLSVTKISMLCLAYTSFNCLAQNAAEIPAQLIEKEINKNPKNHAHRVIAGFHYFDTGNYLKAIEHFSKAVEIQPKDAYDRAWLFMAQIRSNSEASDKSLRDFINKNQSGEYIDTVIKVLLGDITPNKAVELAKLSKDQGNVCEAHYFSAQLLLSQKKTKVASRHLISAINTKKTGYWEYKSAIAQLKLVKKALRSQEK